MKILANLALIGGLLLLSSKNLKGTKGENTTNTKKGAPKKPFNPEQHSEFIDTPENLMGGKDPKPTKPKTVENKVEKKTTEPSDNKKMDTSENSKDGKPKKNTNLEESKSTKEKERNLRDSKSEKTKEIQINDKIKTINKKINITGDLTSEINNNTKKYFINELEVGSASISNHGYISFDINIPTKLQQQGYSTQIFEDAINHFKNQGKIVNGIQGRWLSSSTYEGGMSTNLKSFIDDYIYNGKTFEEAALNTPTGKIASRKGFTKVVKGDWDILDIGGNRPAEIYWIEIKFIKP